MKPTTPRLTPKQQPLKPTAPLRPATAPKRPFPTRKGDGGFNPTQVQASKGDTGFTREISDAPGQQQGQSYTKVAHNFPRSLLETTHKRCNYNDVNSWFEIAAGELRATFKSHRCGWHRRGQRFNLFGNVQPHREDSTRSEGVESSRSGAHLTTTSIFVDA